MKARTGAVLVLLLAGAGWWFSRASRVVAPSVPPLAVAAPGAPAAEAKPSPPVSLDHVTPLSIVAPPDAGADEELGPPNVVATYLLQEGNTFSFTPNSMDPFQVACRREAAPCAAAELFWETAPSDVEFKLRWPGDEAQIVELGSESRFGTSRFRACLLRAMKAVRVAGTRDETRSCLFRDLREAVNDPNLLVADIAACLGPSTAATSVTVSWQLVVVAARVEVRHLEVTAEGVLDGYARKCIERAATPLPRSFGEDNRPSFKRLRKQLRVMTFNRDGASNVPADSGLVFVKKFPALPEAQLTPEQSAQGDELATAIRAAREGHRYEETVVLASRCVQTLPRFPLCYRLLGSAAALLAERDQSRVLMEYARHAYERFVEVAEPGDEYVPRVKVILERAAEP